MKYYTEIREYLDTIPVIDTHEHFCPEEYHLTNQYNFYHWFMPYLQFDLQSCGMPDRYLWNPPLPEDVDSCFATIYPLWENVKHLSYARAFRMAIKEFFGYDDLTPENYRELAEKMNATRYKGRYKEVLRDQCHIKYMLNQAGSSCFPNDRYMLGGFFPLNVNYATDIASFRENQPDAGMEDYIAHRLSLQKEAKEQGGVLIKFDTTSFLKKPDAAKALADWEDLKSGEHTDLSWFTSYLFEEHIKYSAQLKMVVCIHTGVWGNINYKNPLLVYDVIERNPNTTFDIYHMGLPFINECGFIGKNYKNAYLNLCWTYIVSEELTCRGLSDWLDYVPHSKIFAFGGDYSTMPENIWAHLTIAKNCVARVLAEKVDKGIFDIEYAKQLAKKMFYDNPARVYGLEE